MTESIGSALGIGAPEPDAEFCEQEAIHLLNQVQPFGLLLAVDMHDAGIRQASRGASERLGLASASLIGRALRDVLGPDDVVERLTAVQATRARFFAIQTVHASANPSLSFHCIAHRSGSFVVLELEPMDVESAEPPEGPDSSITPVNELLEQARSCGTPEQLAELVARQMRTWTGYDRVLVYRFHPDWHGEVIGESAGNGVASLLGLHFPATDIPRPARELFLRNPIRMIRDSFAEPVPIEPPSSSDADERLDLSGSVLRSPAATHLQYLRNLGVRGSLSVALTEDEELWGLLFFHHRAPRRASLALRGACELLSRALGSAFVRQQRRVRTLQLEQRREALHQGLRRWLRGGLSDEATDELLALLARIFEADGARFRHGDRVRTWGSVPRSEVTSVLESRVKQVGEGQALFSEELSQVASPASEERAWNGLLSALVISVFQDFVITLFRAPVDEELRWAGDPRHPYEVVGSDGRIEPRKHFELIVERVRNRARPWSAMDLSLARSLREGWLTERLGELESREERLVARIHSIELQALSRGQAEALVEIARLGVWEYDVREGRFAVQRLDPLLSNALQTEALDLAGLESIVERESFADFRVGLERFVASNATELHAFLRVRNPDDALRTVETRARATERDAQGRPQHVLGYFYSLVPDPRSSQELEDRSQELESLLHGLSHDLKSPLVTARGFLRLAREGLRAGDVTAALDDLDRVDRAAGKMSRIIEDLLEMSRIGRVTLVKEPLDLVRIFLDVADAFCVQAEERGARIEAAGIAPLVMADRSSLTRAIENLVSNAVRHACARPGCRIELGARSLGLEVGIFVKDDGPGIERCFHSRLFKLFERFSSDPDGTGIGLASVARVAQAHGGRAWVESEPGKGATFWIALPDRPRSATPGA